MGPTRVETQTKANLADKGTWFRLIYMILFAVIFNVAELVIGVVVVIQFLFKLLTGRANERLRNFGQKLATYFQQIVGFLTYHTEDMPYPFGEWPGEAGKSKPPAAAQQPQVTTAKAVTAKKTTAKKKPKPGPKAAPKAEGGKPADQEPRD